MKNQEKKENGKFPISRSAWAVPLLIVIISGAAVFVGYHLWNRLVAETVRSNDLKAALIAKVIVEHEKATIGVLRSYASQPNIIHAIRRKDQNEILWHFRHLVRQNPEIEVLLLTDPGGRGLINFPIYRESWNKDLSYRDWYKGVSREWKPYISGVYKLIIGEKDLGISICVPVFDEKAKVIGILVATQKTEFFRKLVDETGLDPGSKIALIDQDGQIIYSNRFPYRREVITYPALELAQKALKGQKGKAEVQDSSDEGKTKYVSFAAVEGAGWSVMVEKAKGDVFQSELKVFGVIASISGLLILLTLVTGRYFGQRRQQIAELEKINRELDARVQERTAGIEAANAQLRAEIADRAKAEQALRESEEKANALIRYAPTGIYELDYRGPRFISVNDAMCRILGFTREELFAAGPAALLDEESRARFVERIRRQLAGEKIEESVEFRVRKKDGTTIDAILNVSLNAGGNPYRALVVAYDITERKRMEKELRRSRDELEERVRERTAEIRKQAELIELSHDAILAKDLENRILFWSKGAEEVYGWRKEEAIGKITHDLFQTQFPLPLPEITAALMEIGRWDGELSHFRRDGRKISVLSRQAVQQDEAGAPAAILEINIDITQRKKMEEDLRQAQKMESLGTLAGGIAHDFNNLLMPILLNAEMALMDINDGVLPPKESLEMAIAGATRGKELVQQIITFSRHKGEELKPVDIAPLTKETIRFLRSVTPTTVRFAVRIQGAGELVLANPTQIHQVLMNLVNNAVYSMEEKEGVLEISLEKVNKGERDGMKAGSYVCLRVKDTGQGMSAEVREKAFDPFFTTKAPGKGAGMGLAVVHGIVKKHGGEIRLESEPGKGTAVSVFLPICPGAKKEEIPAGPAGIPTGNERILFIDDEESQTRTVEAMLQRLGYRLTAETDPRKALEMFRAQPQDFDLVITDQAMPYLPGDRLCKELLSLRPDIPVILCTGYSEKIDQEKAGALGIREFILKPFTMNEISQSIRRALDGSEPAHAG